MSGGAFQRGPAMRPMARVREAGLALLPMAIVGLLHRRAMADPWVGDRVLVDEPAWFQLVAPLLHTGISGATTLSRGALAVVDPLTSASPAGDLRALAAACAAVAAGLLLATFRTRAVPMPLAVGLSLVPALGSVLPVAAPVALAHAVQMALSAGLVFLLLVRHSCTPGHLALAAALTVIGATNHLSLLAFAVPLWVAAVAGSPRRNLAVGLAVGAMVCGLFASTAVLAAQVGALVPASLASPGPGALLAGLITGRFDPAIQPSVDGADLALVVGALPAPVLVTALLAMLAVVPAPTRRTAVVVAASLGSVIVFTWRTWLPDPAVAFGSLTIGAAVLASCSLSWLWADGARATRGLALACTIAIASFGWLGRIDPERTTAARHLRAFSAAIAPALAAGAWTIDRLAVERLLLSRDAAPAMPRVPARADLVLAVDETRPVVLLPEAAARLVRDRVVSARAAVPGTRSAFPDDPRLATRVLVGHDADLARDAVAVLGDPVDVDLGWGGDAWFGPGWHDPERRGDQDFRWTGALHADVHVAVARRQALCVALRGRAAVERGQTRGITLRWNDTPLPGGTADASDRRLWTVPERLVRRGPNNLTIVVDELVLPTAGSGDTRHLGAEITALTIAPAGPDRAATQRQ